MDVNKKKRTGLVYFFECISMPKHYIIRVGGDIRMKDEYLKFNRLDRYHPSTLSDENKAKGLDYGYPKVDVKEPIEIEVGNDAEKFRRYLLEKFENSFVEETLVERNWGFNFKEFGGWYFIEILEPEKWLNDFYDFQNIRHQEFKKANGISVQTTLF